VDLGERLSIDLKVLTQKLNKLQNCFVFESVEAVTAAKIGEPDINYEWHSFQKLFDILKQHAKFTSSDYIIGVTRFKVTDPAYPSTKTTDSYFSLSDLEKASVVSLSKEMLQFNSISKNQYQYTAYLIMCELLINITKQDLAHSRISYCLFDECADRSDFNE